jgi:hypothetical protein
VIRGSNCIIKEIYSLSGSTGTGTSTNGNAPTFRAGAFTAGAR